MSVQFNSKRLLSGAFSGALAAPLFAVATAGAAIPVDEELVVTATRSPYSADHVASTVRVIDAEQIRASGAHNLSDLLRNLGPVQVQDSMGNGRDSRLALRGFATAQNVLVLVDGRSLNNTDLAGPDLTAVAVGDIERVEILEGGAGTLYGDQAVGGVINIITRSGGPRQGRVSVGHGSYDSENYAGSYQDRFASGLYYRVGSEVERSDAYRDGGAVAYGNYSGRVGWRHADGELFVEARASDDNYRLAGALSAAQVAQDRRQAGSSFNDYNANNRAARIGIDQRLGEYLELFASYGDRNEDVVINSMSSFGAAVTGQQRQVRTLDPRMVFTADGLRVTLGTDVERVDYDFALDFGFGPSGTGQRQRKRSEYLHFIYTPIERLDLQGGLRHARLDAEVAPFGLNYDQSTQVHTVGLNWRGDRGRYYLNRDETFRFALADENIDFMGNFNPLKVQRGVAWELGSEWSWAVIDLHAALFQQDLKHEIGFDPGLGDFGANANFDDTRRRGGTLDARYHATDALVFGGIYTYVDARFVAGPYDNNRVPDVARQLLKLNANYRFDPNFSLFGELVYTGPRNLDLGNRAEVGGYTLANLAATWTRQAWTLQARLNNITDKQYTEFASFFGTRALYPSPERNLMLTLSRDF
ncbi:MAG: TonB-dependent receptor [Porticoccaceae bacterium]